MNRPLKILHLEDLPEDADLVARALKKGGITGERLHVDNREDFTRALKEFSPDVIVSDHSLPSFDSHEALKIVKELHIEVPFILVTATVSEEYAVNIIKEGASDYILKDRLQRLPNAIWAALDKYHLEKENREAQETLRASESKYKLLFESNPMPMWMVSRSTLRIIDVNEAAIRHYGYSREEFLHLSARVLQPKEVDTYVKDGKGRHTSLYTSGILRHRKKDGTIISVDIISNDMLYENKPVRLVLVNDITERIKAEEELTEQRELQQKLVTETSIKVQEREREEIGRELHDNINQLLAASKLYMDYAIKKDNLHSERLQQSRENIILAISEIRKMSQSLVAPSLGNIALTEAIEQLLEMIRIASTLELELIADEYDETLISEDIKLSLYRIVQEQVNNILKHAQATHVSVTLRTTNQQVFLSVKDDGVGFDTSKKAAGIGLRNMTNRAGFFDGNTRIVSAPGKGCILEVTIPVPVPATPLTVLK